MPEVISADSSNNFIENFDTDDNVISPHCIVMPKGLYITAVVFPFFSTPHLLGHWTDLNQTWTHIHLWLLF